MADAVDNVTALDSAASRRSGGKFGHVRRSRILRALVASWPVLLTVAVLCLSISTHAAIHGFQRLTDFVEIGHAYGHRFGLDALATSPVGYDGQYYYFIARFPGQVPPGAFTWPALYYSRIVYPVFARVLALGNVGLIPWMLMAINVTAIVGTVALFSGLLRRLKQPQWLALVPGLYCGQALAMLRDLTDPLFVFWLALALMGVARGRWVLSAAALALGMLTREATVAFVVCLAIPLIIERRWRLLAVYGGVSMLPYLLWQLELRLTLGEWGLTQTSHVNAVLPIPFAGLTSAPSVFIGAVLFVLTCVPALAAIALGIHRLIEKQWGDALVVAAACGGVLYGCLVLVQPGVHWLDIWEPMRLAAPLAVIIPILVPRRHQRVVALSVCWLMLGSVLLALVV